MAKQSLKGKPTVKDEVMFELYGIVIITISLITLASYGAIGRNLSFITRVMVGTYDFVISILAIVFAVYIMIKSRWPNKWSPQLTGYSLIAFVVITFTHYLSFRTVVVKDGGILDTTWSLLFKDRKSVV